MQVELAAGRELCATPGELALPMLECVWLAQLEAHRSDPQGVCMHEDALHCQITLHRLHAARSAATHEVEPARRTA